MSEASSSKKVAAPAFLRIRCLDPLSLGCARFLLVPTEALASPGTLAASIQASGSALVIGQFGEKPEERCLDLVCGPCIAAYQEQQRAPKAPPKPPAAKPSTPPVPDIADLIKKRR